MHKQSKFEKAKVNNMRNQTFFKLLSIIHDRKLLGASKQRSQMDWAKRKYEYSFRRVVVFRCTYLSVECAYASAFTVWHLCATKL